MSILEERSNAAFEKRSEQIELSRQLKEEMLKGMTVKESADEHDLSESTVLNIRKKF